MFVMLSAEGSLQVGATPREVLELACDLRAYMTLDRKIVKVYENPPLDADGHGFVVFRASMRGIRSPKQRQSVKLDRWTSVTFESAGPWLADRLVWMRGGFVVEPVDGGSLVTHSYRFRFKGPSGPLIERYAHNWLQQDLEDELQRIKGHFDRPAGPAPLLDEAPSRPAGRDDRRRLARLRAWRDFGQATSG